MSVSNNYESADLSKSRLGGSSFADSHFASGSWASGYESQYGIRQSGSHPSNGIDSDDTGRETRLHEEERNLCAFWLRGDLYALDVQYIGEVFIPSGMEPVPLSPPGVLGICNLRGTALAVAELAVVIGFTQPARMEGEMPTLLVMRIGSLSVGACIDRVEGIHAYLKSSVIPPSDAGGGTALAGLIEIGDEDNRQTASLLDPNILGARLEDIRFGTSTHS